MDGIFRKYSEVGKRIKDIEKNMSQIDAEIRSLSRQLSREKKKSSEGKGGNMPGAGLSESSHTVSMAQGDAGSTRPKSSTDGGWQGNYGTGGGRGEIERFRNPADKQGKPASDKRLITYLASKDFQSVRPLKHQRRIQRNRAIVMLLIVGALLVWIIGKAFLS